MGYAIAQAFHALGARVSLITGPTEIKPPTVSKMVSITTADEMQNAVMAEIKDIDIFISVAAIADYTSAMPADSKIKKTGKDLILTLTQTKDTLAAVTKLKRRPFCVGFAAETDNLVENAKKKIMEKNLDLIVANQIEKDGFPCNSDKNIVLVLDRNGQSIRFEKDSKMNLARQIADLIGERVKIPLYPRSQK